MGWVQLLARITKELRNEGHCCIDYKPNFIFLNNLYSYLDYKHSQGHIL